MTIVAARSRLFDLFAFHRRSSVEQQNTAARPPNLRGDRLSVVLCFGAIAIGIIALTGYVLGNASITSLSANGKPVPAVTALALILLGAGLLALHSPALAGLLTARRAALAVIVIAAADLLSMALSGHIEEWQVWAARGGVNVHAYPFGALLLIALGSALVFITTRWDFAGHVIASAVLLICAVFAYARSVPSLLDPSTRVLPVAVATLGIILISVAELLARPRGWVVPLLSRTPTGVMSRVLLLATFIVPFLASALRELIARMRWFTSEVDLAVVVDVVEVFFIAAVVLSAGALVYRHERDRLRLASIVDSSDDAIIGTSSAGLVESWNGGAERMYGYTAAEAIGRSVTMLAPPERHDEAPRLREWIRRGERIDPIETVRVTKDGRRVDVWLSVSPVLDDAGNVVGVSTIAHDITGRKKDEEAIRRLAGQYAALLATSSDGFWLVDLEGRLLDVNDAYCRMSGYSREELLKLRIPDIEAIETPEETASRIRSIAESGVAHFETKHRTKDNRILDIEISVSLWRTAGQMLVFSRDITQRKQEQEALRSSEERLQLAQRAAGLGHFSWDIQNNIVTRSAEMLALYGFPPDSLGSGHENWNELIFPDDLPAAEAEIQNALTSGEYSHDFRVIWPDASIHWLHSRAKVFFSEDGKPLRIVGVNMDITERKLVEEELRNRESMLQKIFDLLPVGLWFADKDGKLLRGNPTGVKIWGAEPRVALSELGIFKARRLPSGEEVAPDDWALVHTIRDKVAIVDELLEIDAFDGKKKMILNFTAPVLDAQGDLQGAIVVNHDITELIRAGEALRKSEAALKEGQRVAQIGHWESSVVTGVVTWSDEHYRILGIPIGSVTPSHELFLGMMDPKDRRRQEEAVARALASSDDADFETDIDLRVTTRAGAALVLSQRVFVDRDAAGNVVGFHGTIQDITQRVATEQALRDSEAALAEAQEIAHIGSWILYPESGDGHASAETFRIFAIDPRPLVALQLFLDRVHEDDRARVEAAFALSIQSGTLDVEARIVTPRGTRVVHAIARKHETGDPRFSLIGTIQDITEMKAAEEAIRQRNESLERYTADLERFNRLAVGRELRMIELKQQINDLCAQLGQPAPYVLPEAHALAKETS